MPSISIFIIVICCIKTINSAKIVNDITLEDGGLNFENWVFTNNEPTTDVCTDFANDNLGQPEICGIVERPAGSINPGALEAPAFGANPANGNRCQSPITDLTDDSICWGVGYQATATLQVNTLGVTNTQITYTIDPWSTPASDPCIVEYRINGGPWVLIEEYSGTDAGSVTPVQANGIADNVELFELRFSGLELAEDRDWCYIQDVMITGDTMSPTLMPTELPSMSPTLMPTELPSITPTLTPTKLPSNIPTKLPSNIPTNNPSVSPTESDDDINDDSIDDEINDDCDCDCDQENEEMRISNKNNLIDTNNNDNNSNIGSMSLGFLLSITVNIVFLGIIFCLILYIYRINKKNKNKINIKNQSNNNNNNNINMNSINKNVETSIHSESINHETNTIQDSEC